MIILICFLLMVVIMGWVSPHLISSQSITFKKTSGEFGIKLTNDATGHTSSDGVHFNLDGNNDLNLGDKRFNQYRIQKRIMKDRILSDVVAKPSITSTRFGGERGHVLISSVDKLQLTIIPFYNYKDIVANDVSLYFYFYDHTK